MKNYTTVKMPLAVLALCAMFTNGAIAQDSVPVAPPPVAASSPADPNAATTAMSQPAGTMTKAELKEQRKQQKRDEAAARASTNAAKAQAALLNADAKSKTANDKALQAQEKAGQVTQTPVATTPPPPAAAPETTAPPQ
jgi:hypothetical protein